MPTEAPERDPNKPQAFRSTTPALDALAKLTQAQGVRKPLLLLTGDPGLGKSTLAREAARRWSERATVAWLAEPHIVAKDIAGTLVALFGGLTKAGTSPLSLSERLMETLANATAGGRIAVLVVDDAHLLSNEVLVELRRIADKAAQRQCPLEVLLVGQPALAARLAEPALATVAEQVGQRIALAPLTSHDTRRYILQLPAAPGVPHPSQFSRKACRDIHTASHGVPRDVEAIASEAARRAKKGRAVTVSPEHVRSAVQAIAARKEAQAPSSKSLPRPQRPGAAKAEPVAEAPAKAEGKATAAETAAKKEAPAGPKGEPVSGSYAIVEEPTPVEAEFTPSDDPRVKDWVSRFGGSGVRIGGIYMGPEPEEGAAPEEIAEETPTVVTSMAVSGAAVAGPAAGEGTAPRRAVKLIVDSSVTEGDGPVAWPPPRASGRKGPVLGRRRDPGLLWPAMTLLLAVALGAVMMAQRRGLNESEPDTKSALIQPPNTRETRPETVPETIPETARTVKPKKPAPKPTVKRAELVERSERVERTQPVERTEPVERTPPVVRGRTEKAFTPVRYTVIVGSFLERDMAWAEREHLSRLTEYPVWVSRRSVDGVRTYRVILGAFESVESAETTAQLLLQRGLLHDARVVALPLAP